MQSILYFNAKLKEKTVKFVKEAMCKVKTSVPCHSFYITDNEMFIEREIYEIRTFELQGKELTIWLTIAVMYATYVAVKRKPEKKSGLNGCE